MRGSQGRALRLNSLAGLFFDNWTVDLLLWGVDDLCLDLAGASEAWDCVFAVFHAINGGNVFKLQCLLDGDEIFEVLLRHCA